MNIYSCALGGNFMQTFVKNLCEGKILQKFSLGENSAFGLSDIEIFVPTRRAARALKEAFIAQQKDVFFLPHIIAFADIGTELIALPTISNIERILALSKLAYSWKQQIGQKTEFSDAIWLAQDLAKLVDEAYLHKVNWQKLNDIEQDLNSNLNKWWSLSAGFLKIVTSTFPAYLQEKELLDVGESMALNFNNKIKQIHTSTQKKAYIVLGATGAVPCVADFLQSIALLPNSAIILPSLDRSLPVDMWENLLKIKNINLYGQAQYNYFKLLKKLKPKKIIFLGNAIESIRWRETYVSYALMPAEATDKWYNIDKKHTNIAFENVALIEAEEEREEALAIACALRIEGENFNKKVALVTANRNLARRVSAELTRFGIIANDSAQQPFFALAFGRWLELLLLNCTNSDVHIFLSLLRHPLTNLGIEKTKLQKMVDLYEKYRLRGAILRFSFLDFTQLDKKMAEQWWERFDGDCNTDSLNLINEFVNILSEAIKPLNNLFNKSKINLQEALTYFIKAIELWSNNEKQNLENLYKYEGVEEFNQLCQEIIDNDINIEFNSLNFSKIFEALSSSIKIEAKPAYSNIHIWGIIEARLQYADTVVLGGLNETQFPAIPKSSVFLSRPTMMQIGLEPPEAQIGAEALEFQYLLSMPKVILSRAKLSEGTALVASRWLQRLEAVIGKKTTEYIKKQGKCYLDYAQQLDIVAKTSYCEVPNCKPPVVIRPKKFSISDIEILRSSPYAIYAKKILQLKPLEDFAKIPQAKEKGQLYHDVFAEFYKTTFDKQIIIDKIKEADLPLDIKLIWNCELNNIYKEYLNTFKELTIKTYTEIESKYVNIGNKGACIKGRADRIDILKNNKARIIDYKTGGEITPGRVENFTKPQLLLEAQLLLKNAFDIPLPFQLEGIYYLYLKKNEELKLKNAIKKKSNLFELVEKCWEDNENLIDSYYDIDKAYIAYTTEQENFDYFAYHHLTRYDEWSH